MNVFTIDLMSSQAEDVLLGATSSPRGLQMSHGFRPAGQKRLLARQVKVAEARLGRGLQPPSGPLLEVELARSWL